MSDTGLTGLSQQRCSRSRPPVPDNYAFRATDGRTNRQTERHRHRI